MGSDRLSGLSTELALVFDTSKYESYIIDGPFCPHYLATFQRRVKAMRSLDRNNFDFVPIDAPEIRSFQEWTGRTGRRTTIENVDRDRYERHAQAIEAYTAILERSPRDLAFSRDIREEHGQTDRRELCAEG